MLRVWLNTVDHAGLRQMSELGSGPDLDFGSGSDALDASFTSGDASSGASAGSSVADEIGSGSAGSGAFGSGAFPPTSPSIPHVVFAAVTVAGDVVDFTEVALLAMQDKIAGEAGVPPTAVHLTVEAASVKLSFTISGFDGFDEAVVVQQALADEFVSTSTATTFLTTAELKVSVEAVDQRP